MNADIVLVKSLRFPPGCLASLLSSNGCVLVHFDNIHLKLTYFEVCIHSMLSKYGNSKNRLRDFVTSSLMNSTRTSLASLTILDKKSTLY